MLRRLLPLRDGEGGIDVAHIAGTGDAVEVEVDRAGLGARAEAAALVPFERAGWPCRRRPHGPCRAPALRLRHQTLLRSGWGLCLSWVESGPGGFLAIPRGQRPLPDPNAVFSKKTGDNPEPRSETPYLTILIALSLPRNKL
jgi:hypothetical protein